MGFLLMSHACKQMLPCIEERVKIGEEGYTLRIWFDHENKPFNVNLHHYYFNELDPVRQFKHIKTK
jgi:hypothetical protein